MHYRVFTKNIRVARRGRAGPGGAGEVITDILLGADRKHFTLMLLSTVLYSKC